MEKESFRILVVDDDLRLRDLLKRYLGEQGFNVKTVSDAAQMDRALLREHFDLMVLDLMLPGEDGLSICRRLRGTNNQIPIVMLTAKGDDVDRIVGLEMGADDYLPKPFNPRELVARIHAVLRRQPQTAARRPRQRRRGRALRQHRGAAGHPDPDPQRRGDPAHHRRVRAAQGAAPAPTPAPLPRPPDGTRPRPRVRRLRPLDRRADLAGLRKLIEEDPSKPRYLQTVWGFGYVFVPDGNKHSQ